MKSLGTDNAAYLAAMSYAAANTKNQRTYDAWVAEYNDWYNSKSSASRNTEPTWKEQYNTSQNAAVLEKWTPTLLQIEDMNERQRRIEKLYKDNQISYDQADMLYGAVMGQTGR